MMSWLIDTLRSWFSPPDLGRSDLNRRAFLLYNILLVVLASLLALILFFVLVGFGARIALYLATAGLIVTLVCMALVRFGFLRAAGSVTVFVLWGILSIAIYTFDGVDGTAVLGQLLIIFMAGLLINERWGTVLGLLTIGVNYGAMIIQRQVGLPFPRAVETLQSRWIVQAVYILIGVGLMQVSVRSIRSALSESRWNEQVLKDRVADLRRAQAKLERNEQDLLGRETILKAVGSAAEELFRGETLEGSVPKMLEALGRATGADRVYVFENSYVDEDRMLTSQRFEWVDKGINPQIGNPALQNLDLRASGFGRWMELLSRNAVVRGQVHEFPEAERALLQAQDISSILVVPIFSRTEWWGFMGFDETKWEREWSPPEQDALWAAAGLLGAAIERQRAEQALNQSEARYRAIVGDQIDLISRFKPDGQITFANDAFKDYFGWDDETLEDKNIWETMTDENRYRLRMKIGSLTQDNPAATTKSKNINADGSLRWQEWTDRGIFDDDGNLIEIQAVGRDIDEQERLRREIEQQALTDSLTGLLNRRAIMDQLEMEWHRAKRDPQPLSLVMIDVDYLKTINDDYGHLAGDNALIRMGQLLHQSMRRYDGVGRWGGDEFLLVLPKTSLELADKVARRLLASINASQIEAGNNAVIGLKASLGVACQTDFDGDEKKGVESLLAMADEALYEAKQQGRNRVSQKE
jgi:diguanylate cyclase (GGDEF)-like protein/PAS domain S-box-containing protein